MKHDVGEAVRMAAQKAGMIDLDALALADLSKDDGSVKGAAELVAALKEAKPYLFRKHARDMGEAERAEVLAACKRGPAPEPMDLSKTAKEMSPAEREAFVREVKRRFG